MLHHPYGPMTDTERLSLTQRLADDLELLAEIIRDNPEHIREWWDLAHYMTAYANGDEFKAFVTALKGEVHTDQGGGTRGWSKTYQDGTAAVSGWVGTAIKLHLYTSRDQVCTRVVKGMKTITRKDYANVPEITEEVEDVEWVCDPLLAD